MLWTSLRLRSPLPLETCLQRLRNDIDQGWTASFGTRAVIGRIGKDRLSLRRRISYRNSFQTLLTAKLVEAGGATTLDCRFSMHPFVITVMAAWLGGVCFALASLGLSLMRDASALGDMPLLVLAMPAGMLAFGLGLLWLGLFLARHERQFLTDFLARTIETRDA